MNLKEYRTINNLSQESLARMLYTTQQTISDIETGKTSPSVDLINRFNTLTDNNYSIELERFVQEINTLLSSTNYSAKAILRALQRLSYNQGYEFNIYEKTALKSIIYILEPLFEINDCIDLVNLIKELLECQKWESLFANLPYLYAKKHNISTNDKGAYQLNGRQNDEYREINEIVMEYCWLMEGNYDKTFGLRDFILELKRDLKR